MSIFIFRSDAEIGQKGHFWTDTGSGQQLHIS